MLMMLGQLLFGSIWIADNMAPTASLNQHFHSTKDLHSLHTMMQLSLRMTGREFRIFIKV